MTRPISDSSRAAVNALRSAGVSAAKASRIAGVSLNTAKRTAGPGNGSGGALKAPLAGAESSERALADLEELRLTLLTRIRSDDVSSRDLAALSAEVRKIDASITQLEMLSRAGDDGEPEEVRDAAARVRAKLEKMATKAEPPATAATEETAPPLARVAG